MVWVIGGGTTLSELHQPLEAASCQLLWLVGKEETELGALLGSRHGAEDPPALLILAFTPLLCNSGFKPSL